MAELTVALLRGLNVGAANRLSMKDLAAAFVDAGATNVKTFIQSGNVVCEATAAVAKALPKTVPELLLARHRVKSPVIVRNARAFRDAVAANPHAGVDESWLHVSFLASRPSPKALAAVDPRRFAPDVFEAVGAQLYLVLPNGVARTKLTNAYFDSAFSTVSTLRNWRTVKALLELVDRG